MPHLRSCFASICLLAVQARAQIVHREFNLEQTIQNRVEKPQEDKIPNWMKDLYYHDERDQQQFHSQNNYDKRDSQNIIGLKEQHHQQEHYRPFSSGFVSKDVFRGQEAAETGLMHHPRTVSERDDVMRHRDYHHVPAYYPDNSKKQKKSKKQKHKSKESSSESSKQKSTSVEADHKKEEEKKHYAKPRTVYPDDYEKSPFSHQDDQSQPQLVLVDQYDDDQYRHQEAEESQNDEEASHHEQSTKEHQYQDQHHYDDRHYDHEERPQQYREHYSEPYYHDDYHYQRSAGSASDSGHSDYSDDDSFQEHYRHYPQVPQPSYEYEHETVYYIQPPAPVRYYVEDAPHHKHHHHHHHDQPRHYREVVEQPRRYHESMRPLHYQHEDQVEYHHHPRQYYHKYREDEHPRQQHHDYHEEDHHEKEHSEQEEKELEHQHLIPVDYEDHRWEEFNHRQDDYAKPQQAEATTTTQAEKTGASTTPQMDGQGSLRPVSFSQKEMKDEWKQQPQPRPSSRSAKSTSSKQQQQPPYQVADPEQYYDWTKQYEEPSSHELHQAQHEEDLRQTEKFETKQIEKERKYQAKIAKKEAKEKKKYAGRGDMRKYDIQEPHSRHWKHVRPLETIDDYQFPSAVQPHQVQQQPHIQQQQTPSMQQQQPQVLAQDLYSRQSYQQPPPIDIQQATEQELAILYKAEKKRIKREKKAHKKMQKSMGYEMEKFGQLDDQHLYESMGLSGSGPTEFNDPIVRRGELLHTARMFSDSHYNPGAFIHSASFQPYQPQGYSQPYHTAHMADIRTPAQAPVPKALIEEPQLIQDDPQGYRPGQTTTPYQAEEWRAPLHSTTDPSPSQATAAAAVQAKLQQPEPAKPQQPPSEPRYAGRGTVRGEKSSEDSGEVASAAGKKWTTPSQPVEPTKSQGKVEPAEKSTSSQGWQPPFIPKSEWASYPSTTAAKTTLTEKEDLKQQAPQTKTDKQPALEPASAEAVTTEAVVPAKAPQIKQKAQDDQQEPVEAEPADPLTTQTTEQDQKKPKSQEGDDKTRGNFIKDVRRLFFLDLNAQQDYYNDNGNFSYSYLYQ